MLSERSDDTSAPAEVRLSGHVADFPAASVPAEALDAARKALMWSLGTTVAGSAAPQSDLVCEYATQVSQGKSTVLGIGAKVSMTEAGLVNGCFAKALEWEDKYWMDYGHAYAIATAVVPAALVAAEALGGVTGPRLLDAIAIGIDVEARLIRGVPNALDSGTWVSTYLYSSFGAAAAVARLLRLSAPECESALGLAYAQATGNRENHVEGKLGARLQMGFGVRNGISAAYLAKAGATGATHFLAGRFGLHHAMFADNGIDEAAYTAQLGTRFEGVYLGYKAYPCCAAIHAALDAVTYINEDHEFDYRDIASVKVWGTPRMVNTVTPIEKKRRPENHVDTQFSLPWATASLLIDKRLNLRHFTDAALADQRISELALLVDPDISEPREQVRVELHMKDGSVLTSRDVHAPRGHCENPLSWDEIIEVYRECVMAGAKKLDTANTERAKDLVLNTDSVTDARQLLELLS